MIFHHEKNGEVNKTKRYIFDLIEEKISRIMLAKLINKLSKDNS